MKVEGYSEAGWRRKLVEPMRQRFECGDLEVALIVRNILGVRLFEIGDAARRWHVEDLKFH